MLHLSVARLGFFAIAATAVQTAYAADLPVKAPVAVATAASWTGCYINGGVGYGLWKQVNQTAPFGGDPTSIEATNSGEGWVGRFGGGCDYQPSGSRFVIGAFGDYDIMDLEGTNFYSRTFAGPAFGVPFAGNVKESAAWSIGARAGYLINPALLTYFSAGWTGTKFGAVNLNSGASPFGAAIGTMAGTTYTGWFAGGGTEYALPFGKGLFWRTEYRFASYDTRDAQIFGPTFPVDNQRARPYVQTVTSSLVWRFNQTGTNATAAAPLITKAPVLAAGPAWTGFYLDGGLGYGMWRDKFYSTGSGNQTSIDLNNGGDGWLGRIGIGYDYQLNGTLSHWIIGVFGDYDLMNLKGIFTGSFNRSFQAVSPFAFAGDEKQSSAWYAGARVGYVVLPELMTFASAGWTQTRFDQINLGLNNVGRTLMAGFYLPATTYEGWFIGGGTEYSLPFAKGLFWRNEYRYAAYNAKNAGLSLPISAFEPNPGETSRKTVQTATTSIVWKFDWSGPVVAKY